MNQVNVGQRVGLVIDFVMGMIRYMVLTFAAMILMAEIAQKQNVVILSAVMVSVMEKKLKQIVQKTVEQVQIVMTVNLILLIMEVSAAIVPGMNMV